MCARNNLAWVFRGRLYDRAVPEFPDAYAGAKFKLIRGYSGKPHPGRDGAGEVDIIRAYGLPGIVASHPGWLDKGEAVFLYQATLNVIP